MTLEALDDSARHPRYEPFPRVIGSWFLWNSSQILSQWKWFEASLTVSLLIEIRRELAVHRPAGASVAAYRCRAGSHPSDPNVSTCNFLWPTSMAIASAVLDMVGPTLYQ
jgi:hypothetical protein